MYSYHIKIPGNVFSRYIHPYSTPSRYIHPYSTPSRYIHPYSTPSRYIKPLLYIEPSHTHTHRYIQIREQPGNNTEQLEDFYVYENPDTESLLRSKVGPPPCYPIHNMYYMQWRLHIE